MDNVEKLIDISLANRRNKFAIFNIYISILTLSISGGSFLGSMFGMNLKNNMENSILAFYLILVTSFCLILLFLTFLFFYFRIFVLNIT